MESKEFIGWFKYDPDRLWPRDLEVFDINQVQYQYIPTVDEIKELNYCHFFSVV